jgi:hypothetical protein
LRSNGSPVVQHGKNRPPLRRAVAHSCEPSRSDHAHARRGGAVMPRVDGIVLRRGDDAGFSVDVRVDGRRCRGLVVNQGRVTWP